MAHVCILSYSWVIFLSQSRTNVMCHFTSSTPSKNVIELSVIILSWSNLVSQCFQVLCRAVYCSREGCNPVSTSTILSTPCVSLGLVVPSNQSLMTSFMSSMWDLSWPSFDGFVPVDFRTSFETQI